LRSGAGRCPLKALFWAYASESKSRPSFWYNGPMLVSMETEHNGASVLRQCMKLSPDSKQLEVQISSLVPQSDKTDKLVLAKQ
jgi:hypothetical protein